MSLPRKALSVGSHRCMPWSQSYLLGDKESSSVPEAVQRGPPTTLPLSYVSYP